MSEAVPDIREYISECAGRVNAELARLFEKRGGGYPPRLLDAVRYPLDAGGKRLRPALCLAAAEIACGESERAMPAAVALELVHTYSLVHDDLPCMDDDDLRRGLPTVHKVFGEAAAVLAGDALLTLAFEVLGNAALTAETRVKLVCELAAAAGPAGMIAGQVLDIESEGRAGSDIGEVLKIHQHKTAKLIVAAVRMGAIAGDAGDGLLEKLTAWAQKAGLAFQVADDVLDATGTPEELGKSVGKDEADNKLTAVAVLGVEGAGKLAEKLAAEANEALDGLEKAWVFRGLADLFAKRHN